MCSETCCEGRTSDASDKEIIAARSGLANVMDVAGRKLGERFGEQMLECRTEIVAINFLDTDA